MSNNMFEGGLLTSLLTTHARVTFDFSVFQLHPNFQFITSHIWIPAFFTRRLGSVVAKEISTPVPLVAYLMLSEHAIKPLVSRLDF